MRLQILEENRNAGCTLCPLSKGVRSICIPMSRESNAVATAIENTVAVVVVGEHPGVEEDIKREHFVGEAGNMFHTVMRRWVEQSTKKPIVWYIANAVRCRPPLNGKALPSHIDACSTYLQQDIEAIEGLGHEDVIVLALGGGVRAVGYKSVTDALKYQGRPAPKMKLPVFSTYNPAILLPKKNPAMVDAIQDHLVMLVDFINDGKLIHTLDLENMPVLSSPSGWGHRWKPDLEYPLAFDIETYGSLDDLPRQTVFNARKSLMIDGVRREDLVVSAACTWMTVDGKMVGATWEFPRDKYEFAWFMRSMQRLGMSFLGMNTQFDVSYLLAWGMPDMFTRASCLQYGNLLRDLAVVNFQYSDVRPELSLKQIAPLLRVTDYHDEINLKKGERYKRGDPRLLRYNLKDAAATLEGFIRLRRLIKVRYGPATPKLSHYSDELWSDTMWTVIEMSESGVPFDRSILEIIETQNLAKMRLAYDKAKELCGGPIAIEAGCQNTVRTMVAEAAQEAGLVGDKRLKKLKNGKVATSKDNLHLIMEALPLTAVNRPKLELLETYRKAEKLVGTYTSPLLRDPRNGLVGDMAFPSWYIVPTFESKGEGPTGGTQQGRLAAKKPALPTAPEIIKSAMTSRFPGGFIVGADLSQIELRVAAIQSGDAGMCAEYLKENPDLHYATALVVFGTLDRDDPEFDMKRKLGKTMNFLMLFRGQARKLQETVRRMLGREVPLHVCEQWIRNFWAGRQGLWQWQETLIETAIKTGRLVLPLTGDSRTFKGGRATILKTYVPTICNFPVQDTAAWILKSAQREIMDIIRERDMQTKVLLNIYDAIYFDVPPNELQTLTELIRVPLTCAKLYQRLQLTLGRTLPLQFDVKVYGPFKGLTVG